MADHGRFGLNDDFSIDQKSSSGWTPSRGSRGSGARRGTGSSLGDGPRRGQGRSPRGGRVRGTGGGLFDFFRGIADQISSVAMWYDYILAPLFVIGGILIVLNFDEVVAAFAVFTFHLIDYGLVLLTILSIIVIIAMLLRRRRRRRWRYYD